MTVQELIQQLPKLSKAELEQVRHRIQLLGPRAFPAAAVREACDDWLLAGFANELRRRGILIGKVHKNLLPKAWETSSAAVREHLTRGFSGKLQRAELVVLAQLAAEQLINHLIKLDLRPSPKLVFSNVEKAPAALEAAFPGYWSARVLHLCLRGSKAWPRKS